MKKAAQVILLLILMGIYIWAMKSEKDDGKN